MLFDVQNDVEADPVHQLETGPDPTRVNSRDIRSTSSGVAPFLDDHQALTFDRRSDPVEEETVGLPPHLERDEPVPRQPRRRRSMTRRPGHPTCIEVWGIW